MKIFNKNKLGDSISQLHSVYKLGFFDNTFDKVDTLSNYEFLQELKATVNAETLRFRVVTNKRKKTEDVSYGYISSSIHHPGIGSRTVNICSLGRLEAFFDYVLHDNDYVDFIMKHQGCTYEEISKLSRDDLIKLCKKSVKDEQFLSRKIIDFLHMGKTSVDSMRLRSDDVKTKILSFPIVRDTVNFLELRNSFTASKDCDKLFNAFNELLFTQFIEQQSVSRSVKDLKECFRINESKRHHHYKALEYIGNNFINVQINLYKTLDKYGLARTEFNFFDVTNYYFYHQRESELLQYGKCKEGTNLRLIQQAVLMNEYRLPIFVLPFPGKTADCKTFIPLLEKMRETVGLHKAIYVADKAFNIPEVINYISYVLKHKYLLASKIRGRGCPLYMRDFKNQASPWGQIPPTLDDGAVTIRSQVLTRTLKLPDKTINDHQEKVVLAWIHKNATKEQFNRDSFIKKAKDLSEAQLNSQTTQNKHSNYLTTKIVDSKGNELKTAKRIKSLDADKIHQDKLEDGIMAYVTNLMDELDFMVKEHYDDESDIEQLFRITKTDLDTMPFYVQKDACILGKLIVAQVALLILRLVYLFTDGKVTPTDFRDMLKGVKGTVYPRKVVNVENLDDDDEKTLNYLGLNIKDNVTYKMKIGLAKQFGRGWLKRLWEKRIKKGKLVFKKAEKRVPDIKNKTLIPIL